VQPFVCIIFLETTMLNLPSVCRLILVPTLALALAAGACSKEQPPAKEAGTSDKAAAVKVPDSLFLASAPADAKQIKATKPTLKKGDKVVLIGRIAGSVTPFVSNRASFTLADTALKACGEENPEDHCKTPWDFCCEPREVVTANTVTVQVVDAEGRPLKTGLEGVKGLKNLATVTAVATVATAEGGAVVVNATGLYVKP
jgi:hypothetical protein